MISEDAEICNSNLICFIICVKACSRTVSNFLTYQISLRNDLTTKNININDNDKINSSNIALERYRKYLPNIIPICPSYMYMTFLIKKVIV